MRKLPFLPSQKRAFHLNQPSLFMGYVSFERRVWVSIHGFQEKGEESLRELDGYNLSSLFLMMFVIHVIIIVTYYSYHSVTKICIIHTYSIFFFESPF